MGIFSHFFGTGASKGGKKMEIMRKAAGQTRRRRGFGRLFGSYDDGQYRRAYRDATKQDVSRLDAGIKQERAQQGKAWGLDFKRRVDRLHREYGLPTLQRQVSSLRDQVRRAQNSGQHGQVKELSKELDRSINKEAAARRHVDERVQRIKKEREREEKRYEFDVKQRRQDVWDTASEQWHETVPKLRDQIRTQREIEQLRQQQAQFTPGKADRRLGSRQPGFLPPKSGTGSSQSSRPSFTRPGF